MIEKPLYVLGIFALVLCLSICSGFAAIIKLQPGKSAKLSLMPGDVIITPSGQKFIYQHYVESENGIRYIITPGEESSVATSTKIIDINGYTLHILHIYHNGTVVFYVEPTSSSKTSTTTPSSVKGFEEMMFNPLGFLGSIAPTIPFDLLDMMLNYYGFGSKTVKPYYPTPSKGTKTKTPSVFNLKPFSVKVYNGEEIVFGDGCGIIKLEKVLNETYIKVEVIKNGHITFQGLAEKEQTFNLCNGNVTLVPAELIPKLPPKEVLTTGFYSAVIFKGQKSPDISYTIIKPENSKSPEDEVFIGLGETRCLKGVCVKLYPKTTLKETTKKVTSYHSIEESILDFLKGLISGPEEKAISGLFPIVLNDGIAGALSDGITMKFFIINGPGASVANVFNITPIPVKKEVALKYDGQVPIAKEHKTITVAYNEKLVVEPGDVIKICGGSITIEVKPTSNVPLYPTNVMAPKLGIIQEAVFNKINPYDLNPITLVINNGKFKTSPDKIVETYAETLYPHSFVYTANITSEKYANITLQGTEVYEEGGMLHIRAFLTITPHCEATTKKKEPKPMDNLKHIKIKVYNNQEIVFGDGCGIIKVLKVIDENTLEVTVIDHGKTLFTEKAGKGETFTLCDGKVTIVPVELNPKLPPKEVLTTGYSSDVIFEGLVTKGMTWKVVPISESKTPSKKASNIVKPGQFKCFTPTECVKVFSTSDGYVVSLNNGTGPGPAILVNDTYPNVLYIRMISGKFPSGTFEVFTAKKVDDGVEIHRYITKLAAYNHIVSVMAPAEVVLENGDTIQACDGNISVPIGGALHAIVSGPWTGVYDPTTNKFYPSKETNTTNLWPIGDISINGESGYLYAVHEGQTVTVVNTTSGDKVVITLNSIRYILDPTTHELNLSVNAYIDPEC